MRALDHNKAKCREYSQDVGHAGNVGGRRGLQLESAQEELAFYSSRDCTHIQSEAKLHERQQNAPEVATAEVEQKSYECTSQVSTAAASEGADRP